MTAQSTRHIFLIEPAVFYANPETMETNVYQVDEHEPHDAVLKKAVREFRAFRDMLVENGVHVTVVKGSIGCPDMLFPNWVSTHDDGMVLYPMLNQSRRDERRPDLIALLSRGYKIIHDMRDWEKENMFVEATGSLCLDRVNKIAYAALSRRTTEEAARKWAKLMKFDIEIFETRSHTDLPVYHTDLCMWIGTAVAAVCADCILPEHRQRIVDRLTASRDVIELSKEQQLAFCGNSLEVIGEGGEKMLVMSQRAHDALTEKQIKTLNGYFSRLLHSPIPTIEAYGGGSARCLMGELF
jgi:hypothetical protein